jgi:hypothetical protein
MNKKILIWIFALIILSSFAYADINLTDGVTHYFSMNTTNSTYSNPNEQFTEGGGISSETCTKDDSCYEFDANGIYLDLPATVDDRMTGSQNFSVRLVYKRTGTIGSTDCGTLLMYRANGFFGICIDGSSRPYTNKFVYQTIWSGGADYIASTTTTTTGIWYDVVATYGYDGTNNYRKLYVNGVLENSDTGTESAFNTYTGDPRLGSSSHDSAGQPAMGKITLYQIYNRELNSTEVAELNDTFWPFSTASTPTGSTDFEITAVDDYTGASINNFSVEIDWGNTTTQTFNTVNGSVNLINISDSNLTTTITFFNATDYFNYSVSKNITANTSNSLEGSLFQAQLCLNATEQITDTLILANFTVGAVTTENCLNITAGTHTVTTTADGYNQKTDSISVSALTYTNLTISDLTYLNLTINAIDFLTNLSVSYVTITLQDLNSSYKINHTADADGIVGVINASYIVIISKDGFATLNNIQNITINGSNKELNFTLYPANGLLLNFLDEDTNTPLTNLTINIDLIRNEATALENTTSDSDIFYTDLAAGDYNILYSANGYDERSYYFTLTNNSFNQLNLYLKNSSEVEDITNTLYDEFGTILSGYYIKLLRYYSSENGFVVVDTGLTNSEGKTVLSAVRNKPYYKFRITDSEGTVLKTTTSSQIYDTSLSHYITLSDPVGQGLTNLLSVNYNLTFLDGSDQFKFSWDNSDGTVVSSALYIYRIRGGEETLHNSSTLESSSGIIYLNVVPQNETIYKAKAYLLFNGDSENTLVETLTKTYDEGFATFGRTGLFLTFLIVVLFGLIGIYNPSISCITIPLAVALTRLAKLHSLEWTWITSLFAIGFIIIYLIRDKT